MIKLVGLILIILILFAIRDSISNTIQRNKAIYGLKCLGKKYINVESEKEDIKEWNKYMPILEGEYLAYPENMESIYFAIKKIFNKYLLYHYPNDYRIDYLGQKKNKLKKIIIENYY